VSVVGDGQVGDTSDRAGAVLDTAEAVIDAAQRAGIPYLEVTAEAAVAVATFERYADRARAAGIPVVPAMAFLGGLGDLLATVAMNDWQAADGICIAFALGGSLRASGIGRWDFPAPFGRQEVVGELSTADCVTTSRHLRTPEIRAYKPPADRRPSRSRYSRSDGREN
jgi:hypothetical protein